MSGSFWVWLVCVVFFKSTVRPVCFWIPVCFKCVMEKDCMSGRFWVWLVCVVFFKSMSSFFWIHVRFKCVIEKYCMSGRFWVWLVCVLFFKSTVRPGFLGIHVCLKCVIHGKVPYIR